MHDKKISNDLLQKFPGVGSIPHRVRWCYFSHQIKQTSANQYARQIKQKVVTFNYFHLCSRQVAEFFYATVMPP